MLAGASGSTGQTGASGQTGLTGECRPQLATRMYESMANNQSFVLTGRDMSVDVRSCKCLQGQAAPLARPGLLGRQVSQVGVDYSLPLGCLQAWQIFRALRKEGEACDIL